jgi:acyl carrier protein phosphodiesterase
MNFLAHFHLAWPDDGLVAGGLEGDYLKGPLRGTLPTRIEAGVKLHRAIDAYTDSHPVIQALRRNFPDQLRRYAGILIDLSFDHYLSQHWARFSALPIQQFNSDIYRALDAQESAMSDGARRMAARMIEHDILSLYGDWNTVIVTAARVGQRFQRHNPFIDIEQALAPTRPAIEKAFLNFYPQLQSFCRGQEQGLQ